MTESHEDPAGRRDVRPAPETQPGAAPAGVRVSGPNRGGRLTIATWGILGLLVLCFLGTLEALGTLEQAGGSWLRALTVSLSASALRTLGAIDPALVRAGEWWRLGTSPFLHGSGVHLLLNGLALGVLGKALERHAGAVALLAAFAAGALGGGAASVAEGSAVTVGASGAVLGVAGALYATLRGPSLSLEAARAARRRLARLIALVFAIGLAWNALSDRGGIAGLGSTKISNIAHLGGLLGGGLVGGLLAAPGARVGLPRRLLGAAAGSGSIIAFVVLAGLGASHLTVQLERRPSGVDVGTWLGVGGDLRDRDLPEVRARIGVPDAWRALERRHGYVVLGPQPGVPYLQLRRIPVGGPEDVPDAVVYRMQRSHPDLIAAPTVRVQVAGRRAVRLEMEYATRSGARMQQVRYQVSDPEETLHVIFLGAPPLARRLADWMVATLHLEP